MLKEKWNVEGARNWEKTVIDRQHHFEMNGLRKYSATKKQLRIGKDYDKTKQWKQRYFRGKKARK